jgi:phage-related protein
MKLRKRLFFQGNSLDKIRDFPPGARRQAGFELDAVQLGFDSADWKPMVSVGKGVREVRLRSLDGAFRVIYLAARADGVYVLHAFQKKTQATPRKDIELARRRLLELN